MRFYRLLLTVAALGLSACLFAQSTAPELEPGLPAPDAGAVFTLSQTSSAPSLLQIHPTEVASNTHAGSNFARSMVYAGPHRGVELKDPKASLVFPNPPAVFYVRLSGDDPEIMRNRVTLTHLDARKDRRIVMDYSQNIFGGQPARHFEEVAVAKTDLQHGYWLKLTTSAPLVPGEYGIVFMPKDTLSFPTLVYDFSVAGAPPRK